MEKNDANEQIVDLDDEYLTDLEEQLAEERDEKYLEQEGWTDEQFAEHKKEVRNRMKEFAKKAKAKVVTVSSPPADNSNGEN